MRYVHTNLVAKDWRRLATFYCEAFGCVPVPPERDFQGEALDKGVGFEGAHLTGMHLRLPGWGDHGPTLEVFSYNVLAPTDSKAVNCPGFGHIAFLVDNVPEARTKVLSLGATPIGEVVTLTTATGRNCMWCYLADPEGNAIEIQSWD